ENPLWRKTGVAFQVESLPSCAGDALQIKRVFEAILDNAVKFRRKTRDAYVRISGRRDGDLTVYCIEDNGRGMAAVDVDRAFGMFTKLDPAGVPGHGVGLAVVKRIIEAHQGRITVEAQPGIGSKFFLHLPRRPEILTSTRRRAH
ncbi:MAG TPA: HAMP domain-containing histidine kinase, partial [Halothiobacillaceae bacterium]|nr:HAMP domain-containing histidine kinase [Halothiobacillaceae bacterium]